MRTGVVNSHTAMPCRSAFVSMVLGVPTPEDPPEDTDTPATTTSTWTFYTLCTLPPLLHSIRSAYTLVVLYCSIAAPHRGLSVVL